MLTTVFHISIHYVYGVMITQNQHNLFGRHNTSNYIMKRNQKARFLFILVER